MAPSGPPSFFPGRDDAKRIFIIADGTGRTAKRLMDAVLAQYSQTELNIRLEKIFQEVRTERRAKRILDELDSDDLVIYSVISDDLRTMLRKSLHERRILSLDVLEPMLKTMTKFLGFHPEYKPGLLKRSDDNKYRELEPMLKKMTEFLGSHPEYRPGLLRIIDDAYYDKVDSIGFAVEHDDGRGYQLQRADVILLGLSRSCKTPISMYLACNHGVKAANVPIIANEQTKRYLLNRLERVNRRIVIGLILDAKVLAQIRAERSNHLATDRIGRKHLQDYQDPREIQREIRFCRKLFEELRIKHVDITRRAIEEVSLEILSYIK